MMVRILRKLRSVYYRVKSQLRRVLAFQEAWLAGGKLEIGAGIHFAVPVRVDGRGTVRIGGSSSLGFKLAPRFGNGEILLQARDPGATVVIGERCSFSNNISIVARTRVELGDRCLVGDRVTIVDADFHEIDPRVRAEHGGPGKTEPVKLGKNCWIGTDVMILKGVTLGDGVVVAPKSVVTKSFPDNCVIAGSPAKLVRSFNP